MLPSGPVTIRQNGATCRPRSRCASRCPCPESAFVAQMLGASSTIQARNSSRVGINWVHFNHFSVDILTKQLTGGSPGCGQKRPSKSSGMRSKSDIDCFLSCTRYSTSTSVSAVPL
uniref:(northern house mosquito) hypothetical protein n=1 Tax=Culex pipiens TaxID=7175 RepID=A0A8D8D4C7_CULPI